MNLLIALFLTGSLLFAPTLTGGKLLLEKQEGKPEITQEELTAAVPELREQFLPSIRKKDKGGT